MHTHVYGFREEMSKYSLSINTISFLKFTTKTYGANIGTFNDEYILNLCALVDFPIHIDTINTGLFIVYFKGSQVQLSK